MRSIRFAGLLLVIVGSTIPAAQAQPYAAANAGTGAIASFRHKSTSASLYYYDGATADANAMPLDYDTDTVVRACAFLSNYRIIRYGYSYQVIGRSDQGCGRLTATADPLLDRVRLKGKLRSAYTGSTIAVDVTFRSLTPLLPYVDTGYGYPRNVSVYPQLDDPQDSVYFSLGAYFSGGLRREAQVNGSIKSSMVSLSKRQGRGSLYRGSSLSTETNGGRDECC